MICQSYVASCRERHVHCAEGSSDFLTPSPPAEKATACQDQARKASAYNGAGDSSQWAPDLTTAEIHSVDVKVCRSAFESRNQARLGLRDTA
jgi:hypothetical protein